MSRKPRKRRKTPQSYSIYQHPNGRYYANFYGFRDVLGSKTRKALKVPEMKVAVDDLEVAKELAELEVERLREQRRNRAKDGFQQRIGLGDFVKQHLADKEKAGKVTEAWIEKARDVYLKEAIEFFGEKCELTTIKVKHVQEYQHHLAQKPSGRGVRCPACGSKGRLLDPGQPAAVCTKEGCGKRWQSTLGASTQLHYLHALSNLFRRAAGYEYVPPGFNPVSALIDKPVVKRTEAEFLEVHDAALLLEAARLYQPTSNGPTVPFFHELIATFLLTGGRLAEVLGLAVEDVSFDRRTVTFRERAGRRFKTDHSRRVIPLWPQLEEILRPYIFAGSGPKGRLLFPSPRFKTERPLTDIRAQLSAVMEFVGMEGVTPKWFRHTYCAARLQTLDRGAPVSKWTVGQEMGHGGVDLVERVYGHLGTIRHRSENVEYRVAQHETVLADRLRSLRARAEEQTKEELAAVA